jgi:hypothetical protein
LTPAPCIAPPALPCRPDCRGWIVAGNYLQPCPTCEHWPMSSDGAMAVLDHLEACHPCADLAVARGAFELIYRLFEGLSFAETTSGWTASIAVHGRSLVTTAVYPDRDGAREAGMAWLRRLRGTRS